MFAAGVSASTLSSPGLPRYGERPWPGSHDRLACRGMPSWRVCPPLPGELYLSCDTAGPHGDRACRRAVQYWLLAHSFRPHHRATQRRPFCAIVVPRVPDSLQCAVWRRRYWRSTRTLRTRRAALFREVATSRIRRADCTGSSGPLLVFEQLHWMRCLTFAYITMRRCSVMCRFPSMTAIKPDLCPLWAKLWVERT